MDTNVTEKNEFGAADRLRAALVDQLQACGLIRSEAGARAFRAVPRHLFTPGAALEQAYAPDDAVVLERDPNGVAVSSVSAPAIVAMMLEQAGVRPGDRVLEIGSGGYNAALLAELVGPHGQVTTLDIDPEVTDRAIRCLVAAGYAQVRVVCADGEFGAPDAAPFDVIVVTVGAWDLPPAWWDQLADGGRLVVPLRMRGITRSLALVPEQDQLTASSVLECGFVAMQGAGAVDERRIALHGKDVALRVDSDLEVNAAAMATALDGPRAEVWSQVTVGRGEAFSDLDLWLMATLTGFCLLTATRDAVDAGLVTPTWHLSTPAMVQGRSLAYRSRPQPVDQQRTIFEHGAYGHGPDGEALAQQLVEQIRVWDRQHRAGAGARVTVFPAATPDDRLPTSRALVINKRHTRVVISWP
ncbi:methyltransferase, FxLD system [Micromonospora sp. CPCC 206061]|uniref:methyltransferase, FxLD system n=1 Tax=Micromonospora sp. CPCC 206061 TaxID=3122410 RepID=UPI002FF332E2